MSARVRGPTDGQKLFLFFFSSALEVGGSSSLLKGMTGVVGGNLAASSRFSSFFFSFLYPHDGRKKFNLVQQ
jgi:hypothetical protein